MKPILYIVMLFVLSSFVFSVTTIIDSWVVSPEACADNAIAAASSQVNAMSMNITEEVVSSDRLIVSINISNIDGIVDAHTINFSLWNSTWDAGDGSQKPTGDNPIAINYTSGADWSVGWNNVTFELPYGLVENSSVFVAWSDEQRDPNTHEIDTCRILDSEPASTRYPDSIGHVVFGFAYGTNYVTWTGAGEYDFPFILYLDGNNDASYVYPTPNDDTYSYNQNLTINVTCPITDNVTIWFDFNQSIPSTKVADNVTTPASISPATVTDGTYYYTATCSKSVVNTSIRTWTLDESPPVITLGGNNAWDSSNNTYDEYTTQLRFNITLTDNRDLYAYKLVLNHSSVNVYNDSNSSLSGTSHQISEVHNIQSWSNGAYNVTLMVSDSHTEKEIQSYDYVARTSELEFDTDEGNNIIIVSDDESETSTIKEKDRYLFNFDFNDKLMKSRTFHVYCDNPLSVRDTEFPAHFVCSPDGLNGNWIDFDGYGDNPIVTKITDYHYIVTFDSLPSKTTFNSIGGLNVIEEHYELLINKIGVDNCGTYTTEALNVSIYDHKDLPINITYESTVRYIYDDQLFNYSFSLDSVSNTSYCIYPNTATFDSYIEIEYTAPDETIYNYFIYNTTLSNNTQQLNLYTQNGTSQVLFTVQTLDDDPIQDAYIQILKYNIGSGVYSATEIVKTDAQGQAIGNIELGTTFYNFLIYYEGDLIYTENAVKLIAATRIFTVDLTGDTYSDYFDASLGLNTNLYYNNGTENFVYTWSDPSGDLTAGCLRVDKLNKSGRVTLYDNCTYSSAGTIVYHVVGVENGTTYTGTGYINYNPNIITDVIQWLTEPTESFYQLDRTGALFLVFMFNVTLFLVGIPMPALALIGMLISIIVTFMLQLWYIAPIQIGALVFLGVFQLFLMRKRN